MSPSPSVAPSTESPVSLCELESLRQHQHDLFSQIARFVREDALGADLYRVEKELFQMLLALGKAFLTEVIARHGTCKVAEVLDANGEQLPYQGAKEILYLSIFGAVQIWRAYYWRKGHEGLCPLDALLNLPARRYSYLLDDWVVGDGENGLKDSGTGARSRSDSCNSLRKRKTVLSLLIPIDLFIPLVYISG